MNNKMKLDQVMFSCGCMGDRGLNNCPRHKESKALFIKTEGYTGQYIAVYKRNNKNELEVAMTKCKKNKLGFTTKLQKQPLTSWHKLEGDLNGNIPTTLYGEILTKGILTIQQLNSFANRLTTNLDKIPDNFLVEVL